jgi:hypothetical protein
MTTLHTAGTWKAYRTDETNKRLPVTVSMDEGNEAKIFGDNNEANARLIAASPKLLEAAIKFFEQSECVNDLGFDRVMVLLDWIKDEYRPLIETIIAKATGEPVTQ